MSDLNFFTIGFELVKPLSLHHLTSDFAPGKKPATCLHGANQGMKWYQILYYWFRVGEATFSTSFNFRFCPWKKKPATCLQGANQGMKWYQIIVINKPHFTSQDRSNRAATAASTTLLAGHPTRLLRGGLAAR
jgi:hypothetical protein